MAHQGMNRCLASWHSPFQPHGYLTCCARNCQVTFPPKVSRTVLHNHMEMMASVPDNLEHAIAKKLLEQRCCFRCGFTVRSDGQRQLFEHEQAEHSEQCMADMAAFEHGGGLMANMDSFIWLVRVGWMWKVPPLNELYNPHEFIQEVQILLAYRMASAVNASPWLEVFMSGAGDMPADVLEKFQWIYKHCTKPKNPPRPWYAPVENEGFLIFLLPDIKAGLSESKVKELEEEIDRLQYAHHKTWI